MEEGDRGAAGKWRRRLSERIGGTGKTDAPACPRGDKTVFYETEAQKCGVMGMKSGDLAFESKIACLPCLNLGKQIPAFWVIV